MAQYDGNMDEECIPLCNALNMIPGIRTIESCSGHEKAPFTIWFIPRSLKVLPKVLHWFQECPTCSPTGFTGWHIEVSTDGGMSRATFEIIGPRGNVAYTQSKVIAEHVRKAVDDGTI